MQESETARQILDAAQDLVQTRGYNAFSYRDLAERVGIRTASIHYHFPGKADLGRALVVRYRDTILGMLRGIDAAAPDSPARLRAYADLLQSVLADSVPGAERRICLGGMLAADFPTLPDEVQSEVTHFVEANVAWLTRTLERGRAEGTLAFAGDAEAAATALFAALEGAMLVARSCRDIARYKQAASWLVQTLRAS